MADPLFRYVVLIWTDYLSLQEHRSGLSHGSKHLKLMWRLEYDCLEVLN